MPKQSRRLHKEFLRNDKDVIYGGPINAACRFFYFYTTIWLKVHKERRESFVENKATCSWGDAQQIRQRSFPQMRPERL